MDCLTAWIHLGAWDPTTPGVLNILRCGPWRRALLVLASQSPSDNTLAVKNRAQALVLAVFELCSHFKTVAAATDGLFSILAGLAKTAMAFAQKVLQSFRATRCTRN